MDNYEYIYSLCNESIVPDGSIDVYDNLEDAITDYKVLRGFKYIAKIAVDTNDLSREVVGYLTEGKDFD